MSLQTRWANYSLTNPSAAFNGLSTRIVQADVSHPGIAYDTNTEHHIQAYVFYNRGGRAQQFHIFDANESKTGTIYIAQNKYKNTYGGTKVTRFDVPTGYAHPGGIGVGLMLLNKHKKLLVPLVFGLFALSATVHAL